ncbi:MAG TPA: hypothetical protein PLT18_08275, partial [Gemmiger qucibialis]|nr:hypothetical protein [Gemmiger qucibialis]
RPSADGKKQSCGLFFRPRLANPPAPTKKLWQKCATAFFVVSLKNDELISPFFQTFFTVLSNT